MECLPDFLWMISRSMRKARPRWGKSRWSFKALVTQMRRVSMRPCSAPVATNCGGAVAEVQLDVGQEPGPVRLDREVVVAASDQVGCELALGVQGIGADVLALDVQRLEQRDRHADLVGLLGAVGISVYGEGADFFWA